MSRRRFWHPSNLVLVGALLATILALGALPRLRLAGSLSRLFPDDRASRALGVYVDAFGGGDVTIVLVRGEDAEAVRHAAERIAAEASGQPGIREAITRLPTAYAGDEGQEASPDPTMTWAFADSQDRARLASFLTEGGMRARLEESRRMLLAPGAGQLAELLQHDPLRLLTVVGARVTRIAAMVSAGESGELAAEGGRARFVLVRTEGSALDSDQARRVVESLERAIARALPAGSTVTARVAGGAAIARDVEKLIRRDLVTSSLLSTLLVGLAFVMTFRAPRALLAIAPPLLVGTLWTMGLAALSPTGISAIAMGFASVVIGVGLDTGVHVYAAVLRALRQHPNDGATEIAARARAEVGRPTLTAALAAGCAFGALGLSRLPALRELGLLCAAGEVFTAFAILAFTPFIAAVVAKRTADDGRLPMMERLARWTTGRRGLVVLGLVFVGMPMVLTVCGLPPPAPAVVATRPSHLPSLQAQEEALTLTAGGVRPHDVQLTITQQSEPIAGASDDAVLERLLQRAEHLAAGLAVHPSARPELPDERIVDALASWLPSEATIGARLAERDALDLRGRADVLERVATEVGFDPEAILPGLEHWRRPASVPQALAAREVLRNRLAPVLARHLARSPRDDSWIVATYVRGPRLDPRVLASEVARIDPAAVVTGYPVLEDSLKQALAADLPRIALVALVLVAVALRTVLRNMREVSVALLSLIGELLVVAACVRVIGIPLHAYDALVIPVLIGITVDESMFLLHAMRDGSPVSALVRESRAIVTTAITTAAGFGALLVCDFPGLRDIGAMGVVGSVAGLLTSLMVVPVLAHWLLAQKAARPGAVSAHSSS